MMFKWIMLLLMFAGTTVHSQSAPTIISVTPLGDTVGVYEKFELVIEIDAEFENPYDPHQIALEGLFTSPSGKIYAVPGFYYVEHTPTGVQNWRVRFTPTEVGQWSYTLALLQPKQSGTFTVTPSDNPGFIRIDPRDPRYFAFDDGTPFFPVGENMGWYGTGRMADYEMWLDALAAAGGNYIRVWMAPWGFAPEWNDTPLGNYDNRQDVMFELDQLFEMAEERGIYIMLCLLNHGQFNEATNPEWDQNPYNVANGGMLNTPEEFATNPEAVRLWHQRLRYIAARWGYSTHLFTWEWWNEVNWTPLAPASILAPWMAASTEILRRYDPYQHLITHSGNALEENEVWDQLDFTQAHYYDLNDWTRGLNGLIPPWIELYDKPFLLGEFGYGGQPEYEPDGLVLHLGLWAAPMNGAAGTGMFWWWDSYIHPLDLYDHFTGVQRFFANEDLAAMQPRLAEVESVDRLQARVYGLQNDTSALLWLVNRDYNPTEYRQQYLDNVRAKKEDLFDITFPEVTNAQVILRGLADGDYTVTWWDTLTGEVAHTTTITSAGGEVTLDAPAFTVDWAVKVKPGANRG